MGRKPKIERKNKSFLGKIVTGAVGLAIAVGFAWNAYNTRQITTEEISFFNGVKSIAAVKGDKPKEIVVLQEHPNQNAVIREAKNLSMNIKPALQVFDNLYSRGLRDIIIEGLGKTEVESYERKGKHLIIEKRGMDAVSTEYMSSIEKLVNSHPWKLHYMETAEIDLAEKKLMTPFRNAEKKILVDLSLKLEERFKPYRGTTISRTDAIKLENLYRTVIEKANEKTHDLVYSFFTPEVYTNYTRIVIDARENQICKASKEVNGQIGILLGLTHRETLPNKLEGNYVFVLPKGISNRYEPSSLDKLRKEHSFKIGLQPFDYILRKNGISVEK